MSSHTAGWLARLLMIAVPAAGNAAGFSIVVTAGERDRTETVVSIPSAGLPGDGILESDAGSVPIQIAPDGQAWFVVRNLPRGATRSYAWRPAGAVPVGVTLQRKGDVLQFAAGGRNVVHYQGGKGELPRTGLAEIYRRGGYLHPVFSPSGAVVTDDYPSDHKHHHGIWFPWTSTEFQGRKPDFWNMGTGSGTVEFVGIDRVWEGPVCGGFQARHRFVDLSARPPVVALHETWDVRVLQAGAGITPYFVFDLIVTQACATTSALKLPQYRYGGLGVRGNWAWNGATNAKFLSSEGVTDRVKGNGTTARWCHLGGLINGRPAGIAILGHPDNFRAPQPMRQHPTEPFFNFAPSQAGAFSIEPGRPHVARYRFVTTDGPPDAALLDGLWWDYATPPAIEFGPVP